MAEQQTNDACVIRQCLLLCSFGVVVVDRMYDRAGPAVLLAVL
jgi:hypothetical protein